MNVEPLYPPHVAETLGWQSSSVPSAIAPMEFDLLARSFADGFQAALTELLGLEMEVAVRRRGGHLQTLVRGAGRTSRTKPVRPLVFDYRQRWRTQVAPATRAHVLAFERAAAVPPSEPEEMAARLEDVTRRMRQVTYDHHTLVLPARLAVDSLAEFVVTRALLPTRLDALELLAGHENATTATASRLWQLRSRAVADGTARLLDVDQEGDGYGLQHPGWSEDPTVPLALLARYADAQPACGPSRRLRLSTERRAQMLDRVKVRLRKEPTAVCEQFKRALAQARSATGVLEDHAPLMHANLTQKLRALLRRLGDQLVRAGLIETAADVLLLHVDELQGLGSDGATLADPHARRVELARPMPEAPSSFGEDPFADSEVAPALRRVFGAQAGNRNAADYLHATPGSAGRAVGPVRTLRQQRDLVDVEAGDVVVVPDSGAVWSFAFPVAAAVVARTGSPIGHCASLARDYAIPAVLGADVTRAGLRDGDVVEVDGDSGRISSVTRGRIT
jgi:phosphohistidine swiveling domain-containing protein